MSAFERDVVIVGGCGHVGLPLALAFASKGLGVSIYDVDQEAVDLINRGRMPFSEPGGSEILAKVVGRNLTASTEPSVVSSAEHVVVVIGTPFDEHLNPDPRAVPLAVEGLISFLRSGQAVILRSTHFPGVTALVEQVLARADLDLEVAFCPERIAEGRALTELFELPQIVSGRDASAVDRAKKLFGVITPEMLELTPEEAELAKLFTNTWRYLKFAVANQLYKIANDYGVDYERIRTAVGYHYPRASDLPKAGFAAGPCLLKDTMQLAAFNNHDFVLGHASMMVNEGLPLYVVDRMSKRWDLGRSTVGILGMAFKAESDDTRSSLSYKLRRILRFKADRVLCTDPYVTTEPDLASLDQVLAEADVLVIGSPHRLYADLPVKAPVVDIWGIRGDGVRI